MNLRDKIVSIGCCAAAVFLAFGKPARAGETQSDNETITSSNERCVTLQPGIGAAESSGCERIGGHVRVDLSSRFPSPSGYDQPEASPVAVRLDDGAPPRAHLRVPLDDSGN